jgi:hypothetical protein
MKLSDAKRHTNSIHNYINEGYKKDEENIR